MYISQVGRNTVSACAFCDLLISNKLKNPEALVKIQDQLREHLSESLACKAYYDALPTLEDIRGILKDEESSP